LVKQNKNIITVAKVKEPFGWLSCMSPHPVQYNCIDFRTAEALFQWLRFDQHPQVQKEIVDQKSPLAVKMKARKHRVLLNRGDKWDEHLDDLPRMKMYLELKLSQHPDLKTDLINTGNDYIIEDCTTHDRESARFWGMVKKDGQWIGDNQLGKIWMDIRDDVKGKSKL